MLSDPSNGGGQTSKAPDVGANELQTLLASPEKPFLLDVRQPEEHAMNHIEGSVLIPLGELAQRMGEVPRDRPVVVYCRSGRRSGAAVAMLAQAGYTDIRNLTGGMLAWTALRHCDSDKKVC